MGFYFKSLLIPGTTQWNNFFVLSGQRKRQTNNTEQLRREGTELGTFHYCRDYDYSTIKYRIAMLGCKAGVRVDVSLMYEYVKVKV